MTRFETTVAVAAAVMIAVAYSPALAQRSEKGQAYIEFEGGTKQVTAEVKGGKAKAPKSGRPAPAPAEPAKPVEPTFTVNGEFEKTKEKAKESAIRSAVEKLHDYLLDQDPPITWMPTTELVRKMLVQHPEPSSWDLEVGKVVEQPIEENGTNVTMYQVQVAVKVHPELVRELRSRDRSSVALWVLAGLGGLAGVAAIFFRIDAWTKGYLTSWLVLGTVGAASLLVGMWWWAK